MENLYKGSDKMSYERGFTLIEILVSIAIAGVVMAGIYSAYYSQQKSYVVQEQVATAQQNLRAAMYFMEREIRMAGCDPSGNAIAQIIISGADSIQFSEDIGDGAGGDPNGELETGETISYSLNGTNLIRNAGGGDQSIAQDIQSLSFSYLDEDGGTPIINEEIRSVVIRMTANVGGNQREMTAYIKCRNLGL